jgi:hypothetical protein
MNAQQRTFEAKIARRDNVPIWIGLFGPSGAGKTYSALRLASGISRVTKGPIYVVDSEAGRALSYSDRFRFTHVDLLPPFGSSDYLAAVQYCYTHSGYRIGADSGRPTIIIDSASHEHEGSGGYLDTHQKEVQRLTKGDASKANQVNMLAWSVPSRLRQEMINTLVQMRTNLIWCFRAKEKTKPVKRGDKTVIEEQGWQPITGDGLRYEMTTNILLLPGANGKPTWQSEHQAELAMMKLPEPFRDLLWDNPRSLDEDIGEKMALWAKGSPDDGHAAKVTANAFLANAAAQGMIALQAAWRGLSKDLRAALKDDLDNKHKPVATKIDKAIAEEAKK